MNPNIQPYISLSAIKDQIFQIWPTIIIGIIVSLGGAGGTVLVSQLTHKPIWTLAKDPSQVMDYPPYIGMLSNWGVLLWMTSAVLCIFSTILLKKYKAATAAIRFIGVSGFLSLLLAVDDLYLFHDQILPRIFHLRENVFYILYLILLLSYLAYFFRQILKYEYLLLGVAFLLFALSRRMFIAIPFFDQFMTTGDMLKYFGIVFWLAFFYRTTLREITDLIDTKPMVIPRSLDKR